MVWKTVQLSQRRRNGKLTNTHTVNASGKKVLDPVEWRSFKLVAKDHLSHNTAL